ncbi:hypothetical protein J2X02_002901 [Pseudoxanthomonas japonensis]|uniref:ATP-binding protein n=1 Tax=Pseudoxanthomonas japonensis TaxID=69284 RepID=UPI0028658263|nr:ATP-binding protein [Pseudoxanthomonas japonensis]MDR7070050.1 hypothetical protein [Pseudoxanthomonas japonensis]
MKMIQHPIHKLARVQLRRELEVHRAGHMVFIIGPSGVGKTTIRRSTLSEMLGNPLYWGRGRTPLVEVFATMPSRAYFSSRDLANNLVDELNAPGMEWLFDSGSFAANESSALRSELAECKAIWHAVPRKRVTEAETWQAFRVGSGARGCRYVSIDQVTALLVNHRDTSPADHTLHLMSLGESTGLMFIMTGVYQAARLWDIHSELRRRVSVIWVPPYSDKRAEDRVSFARFLKTVGARSPLICDATLINMAPEILAATAGVVGEVL